MHALVLVFASVVAAPCDSSCSVVLDADAGRNFSGASIRGGTVCFRGGTVPNLGLHDFSPDASVTVRVCDGVLRVAGGTNSVAVDLRDVAMLRLSGDDGDGGRALIIDGTDAGYVMGVAFGGCASRVEIDHLEVFGTSYTSLRMGAETASCPQQRGLFVHHNYFHDVGGEGSFVGMNREPTTFTWADVEFAWNRVERSGYQGLKFGQVTNLWVHDNVIVQAGFAHTPGEDTGFPVGPRVEGVYERNLVLGATSDCLAIGGLDSKVRAVNNLFVDCGNAGIVLGGVGHTAARRIDLINNTIVRPAADGVLDWSAGDGGGVIVNNLAIDLPPGKRVTALKPIFDAGANLAVASDAGFASFDTGDVTAWRLAAGNPAVNAGVLAGVDSDLEGLIRDSMPDLGAHEFGAQLPVVDAGVVDAGVDAGTDRPAADAGASVDAGEVDAGVMSVTDGGTDQPASGGCGCTSLTSLAPLLGLLAFRRRKTALGGQW
ncbi:MAG: right-handed parallel beta-helix repeat-containing protein [Archangium sp.]